VVEFSLWDIVRNLLLAGRWTVGLSLIAFVGGAVVGLLLLLLRLSKSPVAQALVSVYVQLFQGIPLLVQLFLAYYGLGLFGINTSPWVAAGMGLTLYASAFLTEIWRGCVESIPKGQWEASQSLALSFAVPPTVGFLVQVIKGTALASVIGFMELTKVGKTIANATFSPFLTFSCVALMYFVLCYPVSLFAKRLERKMHVHR
jgi:polar amino acid transport system permease protein